MAPGQEDFHEPAHVRAPVFLGQLHGERDPPQHLLVIAGHGPDLERQVIAFQADPLDVDTSIIRGVLHVVQVLIVLVPKVGCIFAAGGAYSCVAEALHPNLPRPSKGAGWEF